MGGPVPPGGITSDNPFKPGVGTEAGRFFFGWAANQHQYELNKKRQEQGEKSSLTLGTEQVASNAKKSLLTSGGSGKDGSHRRRIYGLGKTSDEKQTGTIKKPKLGGQ